MELTKVYIVKNTPEGIIFNWKKGVPEIYVLVDLFEGFCSILYHRLPQMREPAKY